MGEEHPEAQHASKHKGKDDGIAFLIFIFGAYLLLGAYSAFANAKWPFFMPPQLDLFGFLFGIFGNPAGAYIGGAFLGLLGVGCCWIGIIATIRGPRT